MKTYESEEGEVWDIYSDGDFAVCAEFYAECECGHCTGNFIALTRDDLKAILRLAGEKSVE